MKTGSNRIKAAVAAAFLAISCFAAAAFADEAILILYNERPPYVVEGQGGETKGLTADPVKHAFTKSGLAHKWEAAPTKRQMESIEKSDAKTCIVGWFKNPEREKIGKFTVEIYQDKPAVAVAKADNAKMASGKTLDATFQDAGLTLLVKEGFSYGKFIDDKIKQLAPKKEETLVENVPMLKMIQAGRADYMFMAPEEAEMLLASGEFKPGDFKLVTFTDMPEGGKRYLLCSRMLLDADIEKLNTHLKEYRAKNPQK